MTTRSLLAIAGRRWYVIVVGIALALFAFVLLQQEGAYTTQARVAFIGPGTYRVGQTDDGKLETLTAFAAAVEREYHHGRQSDRTAENATLYGAGLNEGVQVLLPNTGGQWQMTFANAAIDVSVVGPSPEWVSEHRDAAVARVQAIAQRLQKQSGVAPAELITTTVIPDAPQVGRIWSTKSMEARALLVLVLIGGSLSLGAAALVDGAVSRRRLRRALTVRPPTVAAARPAGGTP